MSSLSSVGWLRRNCGSAGYWGGMWVCAVPHDSSLLIASPTYVSICEVPPPLHSQVVDLAVEAISPEGITLRSQGKEAAYLPVAHLSDHMELCQPLLLQHQTRLEAALAEGEQYIVRGLLVVCHKLPIRHAVSHTLQKSSISMQDKGTYVLMHKVLCTYVACCSFLQTSLYCPCTLQYSHV